MEEIGGRKIYSVSEANYFAKQTLEQMELWIIGEIQKIQKKDNWYYHYLSLADENTVLPAICTKEVLDKAEITEGQKILAYGFPTLFERKGEYKFKILKIETAGDGVLQKQLQELIKKLKGEGLFDQEHKKTIPPFPKKVCVVTSKGSDAWTDFKRHTTDKFPIIELTTADIRVQGAKSASQLLDILPKIDRMKFDVIVITRGGGSLEDLAAFNQESVARMIYSLSTPTIVAIGHEANESVAEWVADRRASTPTDAANIITASYIQVIEKLDSLKMRIISKSSYLFSAYFQRLDYNYRHLAHMKTYYKDLPYMLGSYKNKLLNTKRMLIADALIKLNNMDMQMKKSINLNLSDKSQRLIGFKKSLILLSPENTLARGYSITSDTKGNVIKSIKTVVAGQTVGVKLKDGAFTSVVRKKL